jgi:hypothetical protein
MMGRMERTGEEGNVMERERERESIEPMGENERAGTEGLKLSIL